MILRQRLESGKKKKSPVIAAVASLFFPGAGQAYNREVIRSLIMILMAIGLLTWFVFLQQDYSQALRQANDLNLVGPIAQEYAKAQGISRFLPLALYLGLLVFSIYDAYVFSAYIVKSMEPRPSGVDRRSKPREDSDS
jgi:TM2 domain-containing membrane protein YozV